MELCNISDLKKMITGRWSIQNWRLYFHPPKGEFGNVDYKVKNVHCGTMKYRIYFKDQVPVLQLKQCGGQDRHCAIKDFDEEKKLLTLGDLKTGEQIDFKKC